MPDSNKVQKPIESLFTRDQRIVQKLEDKYARNPLIRALVNLIPCGSAVDVAIVTAIDNIREDRAYAFFDQLDKGNITLSDELITNESFLHAYFATVKVALNTNRREKIKLFALLFSNFLEDKSFDTIDEYEEALTVLDNLNIREFRVLLILHNFEAKAKKDYPDVKNGLSRTNTFWDKFLNEVELDPIAKMPRDEIFGFLSRLSRTGLCQVAYGASVGWSAGDLVCLTPNFYKFINALGLLDTFSILGYNQETNI